MKSRLLIIAAFLLSTVAFSQQKVTRSIKSFSGIKASEGINVYLKKGNSESVTVELDTDRIDLEDVITEVDDDILKIHLDDVNNRGYKITVHVTFVQLNELRASSAAGIYCDDVIQASSLKLAVSSAGSIEIEIDAKEVSAAVSSAGDLEISGSADYIKVSASSAGDIDAYDLTAGAVVAKASSGGSVKIAVENEISASASSGGSVKYRGNPSKSNVNSSSGGSVRKTND